MGATLVFCRLNEEWAPLEVHTDLGEAAGRAYTKLRAQGQHEAGDLVLGIASELLSFNFRETFVNAFEVGGAWGVQRKEALKWHGNITREKIWKQCA